MKIKTEELGSKYRIYDLAYTEPLRWARSGKEFIVNEANMKYVLNEKQLKDLDRGEFMFKVSVNRINQIYQTFGEDPVAFADVDIDDILKRLEEAEEKQKAVEEKLSKINAKLDGAVEAAVDGVTLTPKF